VTLYSRRERFGRCSAAVGAALGRLPLTANGWTLLGVALALGAALAAGLGRLAASSLLYLLSGGCDLADGAVARERGGASRLGAYLDTLADRVSEAALLFGLLALPLPPLGMAAHYWVFLYLFLSLMVTYAKAAAREKGVIAQELRGGGILERPERVIALSAALLAGSIQRSLLIYGLVLLCLLAAASIIQRLRLIVAQARGQG